MATATKKTVDVVKSVTVQEERVVLDMSKEEAQVLRDVYGLVVIGDGRRQFTTSVYRALSDLGIRGNGRDFVGVVDFKD